MGRRRNPKQDLAFLLLCLLGVLAALAFPKATNAVLKGASNVILAPLWETQNNEIEAKRVAEEQRLKSPYEVEVRSVCSNPETAKMKMCAGLKR